MFRKSISVLLVLGVYATPSPAHARVLEEVPDATSKEVIFKEDLTSSQWALPTVGLDGVKYTGKGMKIAVLSDGLDGRHLELIGRYKDGYNAVTKTVYKPGEVSGYNGGYDGTFIAGVITARNDKVGITGIAPDAAILPVVIDDAGISSDIIVARGVDWAVKSQVATIYLSPGLAGGLIDAKASLTCTAIEKAYNKGILTFVPNFNDEALPSSTFDVSKCKYATTVAAIGENLSEVGGGNPEVPAMFAAPGKNIVSIASGDDWYSYRTSSGAFIPPAFGAGLTALLLQSGAVKGQGAALSAALLKRFASTAIDIGVVGKDVSFGFGVMDLKAAISGIKPSSAKDLAIKISKVVTPTITSMESANSADESIAVSWAPPFGVKVKSYVVEGFYYLEGVRYNKSVTVDGGEVRAVLPVSAANNALVRVVAVIDGKKHIGAYNSSVAYSPVIVYPPDDATVLSANVKWVEEGISVSVKVLYPEFGWDLLIINGDTGDIIRKYKVPAGESSFVALYSIDNPARSLYLNIATGVGRKGIDTFLNPYYSLKAQAKSVGKEFAGVWGNAFSNCKIDGSSCVGEVLNVFDKDSGKLLAKAIVREDLTFSAVFPWKSNSISLIVESESGLRSEVLDRTLWYRG